MDYIFEEKKQFIEALEKALLMDKYNNIESIKYHQHENWEFVRIDYKGGYTVDINTSANSNGANAKEIIAEVYGTGALGRMRKSIEEVIGKDLYQ